MPSSVVTTRPVDPPRRRDTRHAGDCRRSTPCSTRTGPEGCSRPWRDRRPSRSRSTSRSGAPSSATETARPSTEKVTSSVQRSAAYGARSGCQLKEDPQPQVRVALGFEMWKPASFSPSL